MADSERRFTFKLDTVANTAGVAALTAAVKQHAAGQTQLGGAVKQTAQWVAGWNTTVQHAADGTLRWGNSARKTIGELQALKAAAQQAAAAQATPALDMRKLIPKAGGAAGGVAGAAAAASGGGRDVGRAALEVSRAVEDAQYGIAGVLNNLPGLVMMLGGGAGLAGALSLAAVGATQLTKHLGGINTAVDPEILKAKLDAIKSLTDATLAAQSAQIQAAFDADLKAIQDKSEAALNSWKQTLANVEETKKLAETAADSTKSSADAALDAETAGSKDADVNDVQAKRKDEAKVADDRAKLDAEALAAKQSRQAAEMGIKAAREERAAAESFNGPFGSAAKEQKDAVLQDLKKVGIESDQAKHVGQFDSAVSARESLIKRRAEIEQKASLGSATPAEFDEALGIGPAIDALNPTVSNLAPGVAGARDALKTGDVTFNTTDPASLNAGQRESFAQGQAALAEQQATQAAARERAEKAKAAEAEAGRALGPAQAREKQANAAQQNYELNRATGQLNAGEIPDLPPEQMGALLGNAKQRGGLGGDLPLPNFSPPDFSGTEQAFGSAMEQTSTAVQGAVERMAAGSENLARSMGAMRAQIESKMAALEQQLSALQNVP